MFIGGEKLHRSEHFIVTWLLNCVFQVTVSGFLWSVFLCLPWYPCNCPWCEQTRGLLFVFKLPSKRRAANAAVHNLQKSSFNVLKISPIKCCYFHTFDKTEEKASIKWHEFWWELGIKGCVELTMWQMRKSMQHLANCWDSLSQYHVADIVYHQADFLCLWCITWKYSQNNIWFKCFLKSKVELLPKVN